MSEYLRIKYCCSLLVLFCFLGKTNLLALSQSVSGENFGWSRVVEFARSLSLQEAPSDEKKPNDSLDYDGYRRISFNPEKTLWKSGSSPFRLELLPSGYLYTKPVAVSLVEDGKVQDLKYDPDLFIGEPEDQASKNGFFSGFKVLYPLNSPKKWDEVLVFQGASYFRAVSKGGSYGLSARALALGSGHPNEEFPNFTHFWIVQSPKNSKELLIYGLLESESLSGACAFKLSVKDELSMKVDLVLFPRRTLDTVGLAPLTSMFLFDESDRNRIDDFRNEVHDSDGLYIETDQGEEIWRPLRNPRSVEFSSFTTTAPRRFGLIQRSRRFEDYRDLEAHYERRPNAWVDVLGDWGPGKLTLLELPSESEANDNIAAFFVPDEPLHAGESYSYSYRLHWSNSENFEHPLARLASIRSGKTLDGTQRIFVLDYAPGLEYSDDLVLELWSSLGSLKNPVIQNNPVDQTIRASFDLDTSVPGAKDFELSVRLLRQGKPVSETWLYRWSE